MRTPLQDVLSDHPEWEEPSDRAATEARLEALFAAARDRSNAYSAARLDELYQVTDRALTLAGSFAPPAEVTQQEGALSWRKRIPQLIARYSSGLLLAVSAPLVADASVLLAGACGVAGVFSIARAMRPVPTKQLHQPKPKAVAAKLQSLLSAADQSFESATAPLALEDQRKTPMTLAQDDVLSLLQDVMAATRNTDVPEFQELSRNASRLVEKAGYTPRWSYAPDVFEVMVDPQLTEERVVKPALEHSSQPSQSIFGVIVRGRS